MAKLRIGERDGGVLCPMGEAGAGKGPNLPET